jgi:hypothetical protein
MKFRLFAMFLILSLASWAQENPSTTTSKATPKPEAKSCCHQSSAAKEAKGCCGKDKCEAKDGKTCCEGKEMKEAKSCCGEDMKACTKECKEKGGKCCGGEKSAMNCCGDKCERHHAASAS